MAIKGLQCGQQIGNSLKAKSGSLRTVSTMANFKIPVINNEPNVSWTTSSMVIAEADHV